MIIDVSTKNFTGVVKLVWGCYMGNPSRLALRLFDAEDNELVLTASVNLPDVFLMPNQILIKDWSENEGVLNALVKAGIIEDTGERYKTGFVEAALCKILVEPKE